MNTIKLNTIGEAPIKKGGASGGGNYVYYNKLSDDGLDPLSRLASVYKILINGVVLFIRPIELIISEVDSYNVLALGFNMSLKVTDFETLELLTVGEILDARGVDAPRITEEEFYNINI